MNEMTISCPTCQAEIKLTESLAAPLVEATRLEYERRLRENNLECTKREERVRQQEEAFNRLKQDWQASEQERFQQEAKRISAEESRRAALKFSVDLTQKSEEIRNLQEVLKGREERLLEAQKAQAECLRKERELDDQRRELDLTVEKRVQDSLTMVQKRARQEAEVNLRLKVSEKEQTIASMRTQIDDLKRRAEQGSQQLQGEVQELELEALLTAKFRMTLSNHSARVNMAAISCKASSAAKGSGVVLFFGRLNGRRTGVTPGCPSSERINATPRPRLQ